MSGQSVFYGNIYQPNPFINLIPICVPSVYVACIHYILACARLSDSIVGTYKKEQSENKTRTTCLSPAPTRFSHFLLLNDFPPSSRSLEQANYICTLGATFLARFPVSVKSL